MSYWDFLKILHHGQMTCLINIYYVEPKLPMDSANHILVSPCISWKFCLTFKELFYCLWIIFSCFKKITVNAVLKIVTKGRQRDRVWGIKGKLAWGLVRCLGVPWRIQSSGAGGTNCDAYDPVFHPLPPGRSCDLQTGESRDIWAIHASTCEDSVT